jgi:hypothetical protein
VEQGADLAKDGLVRFRRVDLRDRIAGRFGVYLHERSVGKLLRKLDFRRLSVRPVHPKADLAAQETFKKFRRTGAPGAGRPRCRQVSRNLVPGRSKGRPTRHSS